MKIEIIGDNIIVFLNKYITNNLDYRDSKVLESELKKIFDKLEKIYNIKIKGYYDVDLYIDNNYGIIMELDEDDIGYNDFDEIIDMRIRTINTRLLYKIDDILPLNIKHTIYLYKKNLYLEIDENINNIEMGKILENSEIIYKNTDDIIKYGKVLKTML